MTAKPPPPCASTTETVRNTPLVRLQKLVPPDCADVYVKLEYFNPTGSYKDRMALSMVEEAEARGSLRPGMTVVECTGGSTGTSLAFVCAVKGYDFQVVSSDAFAKEKLQTMRLFGADLLLEPSEGGQITPDLVPRMLDRVERLGQSEHTCHTEQFKNTDALVGYAKIGEEILQQLDGRVGAFCGGVGTAGMLMGVSRAFRQASCTARIVALEPASAPLLSEGTAGTHHVEGIGVGFVPPLLSEGSYDEARSVEEPEARQMARQLARQEGIFAGTSSGLNVVAALALAHELGPGQTVVTVACDSGMKYLAGDLFESSSGEPRP